MKATMVKPLLALALLAALAGCSREDSAGPAERLGKALDDAGAKVTDSLKDELAKANRAAEDARDKVEDATRDASRGLKRATDEVGKSVERAGEKMQNKAEELKRDKDD